MTPATYKDIPAAQIPAYELDGLRIKAIAGRLPVNGQQVIGAVTGRSTDPAYLDLASDDKPVGLTVAVPDGHTVLLYVYEGSLRVGDAQTGVARRQLARLSRGGEVRFQLTAGSRALLIAGRPIGEPIVHYGPFVMNSRAEIEQAINDYNAGRLTG